MNQRIARFAAVGVACAGLCLAACQKSSHSTPDYGVTVNAIPGLPSDFIKGADVSMLAQLEASGAKFYDESGKEKDALRILKEHGVNWVRLRVWNHPVIAHDFATDGMTVHAGESAGGINDAARDATLARRAKDLGMKVLLDFHYSDWWADPAKQWVPQAWEGMDLAALETAIHDYTAQTLATMTAAGATPDMVQLGNETNDGFLWPVGRVSVNGYGNFAALLSSAAAAVRAADPNIKIMIHLANGNNNSLYRSMFSALVARDVDFDIIGLSFYPYWHNSPGKLPMNELAYNLNDISEYFNKPVVVVETAYAYTLDDADSEKNSFGAAEEAKGGYVASVQGQTTFLRDLMETVAGVPGGQGLGIFYWEPEWTPVAGAGWYTNGGDGWDNQTLFDTTGKALPSMNVFRAVSQDRPEVIATPKSVEVVAVSTWVGLAPSLPGSVQVTYSDDSVRPTAVLWDDIGADSYAAAGTFTVAGTIPGVGLPATAQVTVTVNANLLTNPGLETGTDSSWTVTDASDALSVSGSDVRTGSWAFHWYLGTAFSFTVEQTVSGLQAGKTYQFSFWAMGNSGEPMHAYATCGATTTPLDFTLAGWTADPNSWLHETISGLDGTAGSCTVGVTSAARAGDWGSLDDFSLVEEP
jgi:arabinogalactan endo-1,4-beta-galactosidase